MNENIWASIFSAGTFNQMLRSATPVALAALGGLMTEHAGIMPMFIIPACSVINPPIAASATGVALRSI